MYWVAGVKAAAATVVGVGVLVYGSFALYEGSWSLAQHNIVHQQGLNNAQYQANVDSQSYQATFVQQADKDYEQVTLDKFNIEQAKAAGDTTGVQDAYAAVQADIHMFCQAAAKLTDVSKAQLQPAEMHLYNSAC